jgi:2-polyprenyl-3-methyl-5-hydroxy-6-metoxy-1,4-benzoquinol methylase
MNRADDLYDDEYCAKISSKGWRVKTVPIVVNTLDNHFKPNSVIDFGCSNGLHLAQFRKLGMRTFGIEGTLSYRQYIKQNYDGDFAIVDMRLPFDINSRFELAICIEVLEHIEDKFANIAVENICRHSDNICITASPINTARYHVNGQDKGYWIEKFVKNGVSYRESESNALESVFKRISGAPNWMRENLMIFRRVYEGSDLGG